MLQSFLPGITAGNSQVTCQSHLQPPSKGNLEKKNSSSFLSPQDHVLLPPSRAAMTGIGNFSQAPIISLPRATKGPTYQNCLDYPKNTLSSIHVQFLNKSAHFLNQPHLVSSWPSPSSLLPRRKLLSHETYMAASLAIHAFRFTEWGHWMVNGHATSHIFQLLSDHCTSIKN